MNTLRDTVAFVVAALTAPVAGATVIASVDAFLADKHSFAEAWGLLWLGDASGIMAVAPLILVAARMWASRKELSKWLVIEAVLIILAAVAILIAAMHGWQQFAYANLPLLAWLAVRTRFAGTAVAIALLTVTATIIVSNGFGVFGSNPEMLQIRSSSCSPISVSRRWCRCSSPSWRSSMKRR